MIVVVQPSATEDDIVLPDITETQEPLSVIEAGPLLVLKLKTSLLLFKANCKSLEAPTLA